MKDFSTTEENLNDFLPLSPLQQFPNLHYAYLKVTGTIVYCKYRFEC